MRFKNFERKKENVEYFAGDVLIVYNETLCEEEVYMVIKRHDMYYNLIDLDMGVTYFSDFEIYDNFVRELESRFYSIETIDNSELELVGVEMADELEKKSTRVDGR